MVMMYNEEEKKVEALRLLYHCNYPLGVRFAMSDALLKKDYDEVHRIAKECDALLKVKNENDV